MVFVVVVVVVVVVDFCALSEAPVVIVVGDGVVVVAAVGTNAVVLSGFDISFCLLLFLWLFLFGVIGILVGVIVLVEHLSGGSSWWRFHHVSSFTRIGASRCC